jgi:hypothetical protein
VPTTRRFLRESGLATPEGAGTPQQTRSTLPSSRDLLGTWAVQTSGTNRRARTPSRLWKTFDHVDDGVVTKRQNYRRMIRSRDPTNPAKCAQMVWKPCG